MQAGCLGFKFILKLPLKPSFAAFRGWDSLFKLFFESPSMSSLILARLAHRTNISKHIIVVASIYDFLIMMVSLSTTVIPLLYSIIWLVR
jgi:hypothetical protein